MTVIAGVGHFVPWDGGCLLIGDDVQVVPLHAHYAIQVAFGSERGLRFKTSERADWVEYDGAIIPSRQPHSMDARAVRSNAVLLVEPETQEGRALAELYLKNGIAAIPAARLAEVRDRLFSTWRERRSSRAVTEEAWGVIHSLTGTVARPVISDERILRVVTYIKAHLDAPITLEDIAAEACLSPSRFRHLFVEQTGMALRPYILWRRFLYVWELVTAGESLSMAAHNAGFADAAHLTRTSRRMFGFPPSAMQIAGQLPAGDDAEPARVR